jgi:hypothetical protein
VYIVVAGNVSELPDELIEKPIIPVGTDVKVNVVPPDNVAVTNAPLAKLIFVVPLMLPRA